MKSNPPTENDNILAARLRELAKENGTRQYQLAKELSLSRQAVQKYMDGSASPNWRDIVTVAKFFGVSTDYLLGASDVRSPDPDLQGAMEYTGLSEAAVKGLHHQAVLREKLKEIPNLPLNIEPTFEEAFSVNVLSFVELFCQELKSPPSFLYSLIDETIKFIYIENKISIMISKEGYDSTIFDEYDLCRFRVQQNLIDTLRQIQYLHELHEKKNG